MKTRLLLFLAGLTAAAMAADRPALLPAGTAAPDFTALRADGQPVKLSNYQGQVVLVDFWATWCGPCKKSMPHMEELYQKLQPQGLVVLGVCVWDTKDAFDHWQIAPEVKTSYLKVFDPAAKSPNNIAHDLYQVSGIPTFYLIGKDGKVLFTGVGYGGQTESNLNRALTKAGFSL